MDLSLNPDWAFSDTHIPAYFSDFACHCQEGVASTTRLPVHANCIHLLKQHNARTT